MIYSGDKTLDPKGYLGQATEDFAMVMCKHYYTDVKDAYTDRFKGSIQEMSNTQLIDHLHSLASSPCENSSGHFLIADDCETLSGLIKSTEAGVHHEAYVLAGCDSVKLGQSMWECTRDMKNLSAVPKQDFESCAKLFVRYAQMKENSTKGVLPSAQIGLCVVSAKGPSFSLSNCELNGHSCTVAQTLDATGKASYVIGEGTTNLQMRNLPDSCPKKVSIVLSTGSMMFNTAEALGIISENMGSLVSTKGQTRVGQCIPSNFDGKDPYTACPFYMASFYLGLEMGSTIPGVIPLDTRNRSGVSLAEGISADMSAPTQPLFGAPVACLSDETVRAVPINLGRVLGEQAATDFLESVKKRNLESYPPRAETNTLKNLGSRWGDLESLVDLGKDSQGKWTLSCAESFADADMLRGVTEYKRRLAREFNALQARDPLTDGVKMVVKQHMLSAVCHFHVPLPVREKWDLSCARNMRQAIKALPLAVKTNPNIGGRFCLI